MIEGRNGANAIAHPRLGLGQRDLQEPVEIQKALLASALGDAAHVAEPLAKRAALSRRQALEKSPERSRQRQIMLTRETGSLRTGLSRARSVASHQFEHRRMYFAYGCVPICATLASRSCAPSTRDTARLTFPSGHDAIAR